MIPGRVAFLSSPEKFANFVIKICKISAGVVKFMSLKQLVRGLVVWLTYSA